MKKTPSLLDLQKMAEQDTDIDDDKLEDYSNNISKLVTKWNIMYSDESLVYEALAQQYSEVYVQRWEYYQNEYTDVIIENKSERQKYMDADPDLKGIKWKMSVSKSKMQFIETTMTTIRNASFNIKNAIDFMKFKEGF